MQEMIIAWLRSKNGDTVVSAEMAKKFKVGESSILAILNEMVLNGIVRRAPGKRGNSFYIPSPSMLAAEVRSIQETILPPPMKVDRARQELYARLDADRASIRSIG